MTFGVILGSVHAQSFAQTATYPPGSTFGPRVLADFELVWILEGGGLWWTSQEITSSRGGVEGHLLRPGDMLIARRGATDSYQWSESGKTRHAFIHFNVDERVGSTSLWPSIVSSVRDPALSGLSSYLIQLATVGSDAARARSNEIVAVLVDIFVRGPLTINNEAPFDFRLMRLLTIVRGSWEGGPMYAVSNQQLADWSNLSQGHLSRLFRSNFASGPKGVIETARLVSSAINLQRTDLPLRAIASAAGYTNEYHFSRRFVNLYQMPPARFRRAVVAVDPMNPVKNEALLGAINLLLAGTVESNVALVAQNSLK